MIPLPGQGPNTDEGAKSVEEQFNRFLENVDVRFRDFVVQLHGDLTARGCSCEIKTAKSGWVVSYVRGETKRTLATYVSRKSGKKIRIFPGAYCPVSRNFGWAAGEDEKGHPKGIRVQAAAESGGLQPEMRHGIHLFPWMEKAIKSAGIWPLCRR